MSKSLDSDILTKSWVLITEIEWNSDPILGPCVFHISLNQSSVVNGTTLPHAEMPREPLIQCISDTTLLETQLHQYRGVTLAPCQLWSQGKLINDGCKWSTVISVVCNKLPLHGLQLEQCG